MKHTQCWTCSREGSESITCNSNYSLDEIFDLVRKYGKNTNCSDCGSELYNHLKPKYGDDDEMIERWDFYKLLELVEDADRVSLSDLLSCYPSYNPCYTNQRLIEDIMEKGFHHVCSNCGHNLRRHIKSNISSVLYSGAVRDLLKCVDYNQGYVRLHDLIEVGKPERRYDSTCKNTQCTLGVIRKKCSCESGGMHGMKVTCNDKIGQLREDWSTSDLVFQEKGHQINLVCKHCELELDQFEPFFDKIPSIDWTIKRIVEARDAGLPEELTDIEVILLNEIEFPDIRYKSELEQKRDSYRQRRRTGRSL